MKNQKISRLVMGLRWLVYLVMAVQIGRAALFLNGDDKLNLIVNGDVWSRAFPSFEIADQIFLLGALCLRTAVYLWGLFFIARLCRLFDGGVIFATETIVCFKKFSLALIVIAVVDILLAPVLITYLWLRGILAEPPLADPVYLIEFLDAQVFMAGVLFFIIARIMEMGLEQKTEAELTI